MKKFINLLVIPVILTGFFLFSMPLVATAAALPKDCRILDIDISGLKKSVAEKKIRERITENLKNKTLIISAPNGEYIFGYPEINFESNLSEYLTAICDKRSGKLKVRYYLNNADDIVKLISQNFSLAAKEAEITFTPNGQKTFEYQPEKYGKDIDKNLLISEIEKSINSNFYKIIVKTVKICPKTCVNDLKKFTFLKSEFSTEYPYSQAGRKHNIWLGSTYLNGAVIKSGEEFSFNNKVGQRTKDRGFEEAKIIFDGKYIDGVGGGVCQISTTLYNAVIEAGLEITEHHAHSMCVGYVPPSFDAMVNSGTSDLKFKNNTDGDIYIKAIADGKKLTITIFGQQNEYEYRRLSKVIEEILPPEPEIIEGDSEEILQYAKNGVKSQGFLELYKNGKFIKRIQIRSDTYKPTREIKKVIRNEL